MRRRARPLAPPPGRGSPRPSRRACALVSMCTAGPSCRHMAPRPASVQQNIALRRSHLRGRTVERRAWASRAPRRCGRPQRKGGRDRRRKGGGPRGFGAPRSRAPALGEHPSALEQRDDRRLQLVRVDGQLRHQEDLVARAQPEERLKRHLLELGRAVGKLEQDVPRREAERGQLLLRRGRRIAARARPLRRGRPLWLPPRAEEDEADGDDEERDDHRPPAAQCRDEVLDEQEGVGGHR